MYVARIIYPIRVLGPGKRVGIWFAGCHHACKGCSNPELWEVRASYQTTAATVLKLIEEIGHKHPIDGFTITGGEPFDQRVELAELLKGLVRWSEDILIYTGYEWSELTGADADEVLRRAAVLIDGRYIEEQNEQKALRGSANQRIHYLKPEYRTGYEEYLAHHQNEIQNFTALDGVISVGIHRAGFNGDLDQAMQERGFIQSSRSVKEWEADE
jgi:anaerobic ribonucleoside-triphosphate reductase activating protein